MRNPIKLLLVLCCFLYLLNATTDINQFREKIELSKKLTNDAIDLIMKRWDIVNYPNFLRSVHMTHTAWEILKVNTQIISIIFPISLRYVLFPSLYLRLNISLRYYL